MTGCYCRDLNNKDPFLAILQDAPISIHQRNVTLPDSLANVIDLALQDNPELHFKDVKTFKQALINSF
ncbi:hypothetical protein [Crocosphaera sp.]|uniref:hypothetical protein n=1 Tax=Crocosphaera sp. TaxID=2729996 RepID=UPI003F28F50B|nr:hypothetical protein [Crocosphaera sp.]